MILKSDKSVVHLFKRLKGYSVFQNNELDNIISKAANVCCNSTNCLKYDIVEPFPVSAKVTVGEDIVKPDYWLSGIPSESPKGIEIKTKQQIAAIKDTCQLARTILQSLKGFIKAGVRTDDIDTLVHRRCVENKAYPSPLNYRNFPKSVCTSVNNVACHGIPDKRPLKNGDILNVDVTVYQNGMHGDCSAMFLVGEVDQNALNLCSATKEALEAGISVCRPGCPFSLIGKIIEEVAKEKSFAVVPAFLGHGIGSYFHGPPDIYHFDVSETSMDKGLIMKPGMTFTIEPVLSERGTEVMILEDGWTAVTTDNSRTAQWEHTVLITEDGVEILT